MSRRGPRKKLTAVAVAWATGGSTVDDDDEATANAKLPDWIKRIDRDSGPVELRTSDQDLVALFYALGTQWRYHPSGPRVGLEYAAIAPTAAMLGFDMTPARAADLRVMELAALKAWSERDRGR